MAESVDSLGDLWSLLASEDTCTHMVHTNSCRHTHKTHKKFDLQEGDDILNMSVFLDLVLKNPLCPQGAGSS